MLRASARTATSGESALKAGQRGEASRHCINLYSGLAGDAGGPLYRPDANYAGAMDGVTTIKSRQTN